MNPLEYLLLALAGLVVIVGVNIAMNGLPDISVSVPQEAIESVIQYADDLEIASHISTIAVGADETTRSLQKIPEAIYLSLAGTLVVAVTVVVFTIISWLNGQRDRNLNEQRLVAHNAYLNDRLVLDRQRLQYMEEDREDDDKMWKRIEKIDKRLKEFEEKEKS